MNELAKTTPVGAIASAAEVADLFGGSKVEVPVGAQLPTITMNKDLQKFIFPGNEAVESFRGHILHWHNACQFYSKEYGKDSSGPPQCSSSNGLTPDGGTNPFKIFGFNLDEDGLQTLLLAMQAPADVMDDAPDGDRFQVWMNKQSNDGVRLDPQEVFHTYVKQCAGCPANAYETDLKSENGAGKACQNSIWLYILPEGYRLPMFLKAGPASLGAKGSLVPYLTNAQNIGLGGKYQTILTEFRVEKRDFSSGMSSCRLLCKKIDVLKIGDPKLAELGALYKSFCENYLSNIRSAVASGVDAAE